MNKKNKKNIHLYCDKCYNLSFRLPFDHYVKHIFLKIEHFVSELVLSRFVRSTLLEYNNEYDNNRFSSREGALQQCSRHN